MVFNSRGFKPEKYEYKFSKLQCKVEKYKSTKIQKVQKYNSTKIQKHKKRKKHKKYKSTKIK